MLPTVEFHNKVNTVQPSTLHSLTCCTGTVNTSEDRYCHWDSQCRLSTTTIVAVRNHRAVKVRLASLLCWVKRCRDAGGGGSISESSSTSGDQDGEVHPLRPQLYLQTNYQHIYGHPDMTRAVQVNQGFSEKSHWYERSWERYVILTMTHSVGSASPVLSPIGPSIHASLQSGKDKTNPTFVDNNFLFIEGLYNQLISCRTQASRNTYIVEQSFLI